ncbi:hypothetical protein RhiirB3_233445 [Rhizophagus irregularis]|nr:hypothetical protein RhiirB3_233445 [Rhizophagus irregularis]
MAVTRVKSLIKQLGLLQSKLSNIFDELALLIGNFHVQVLYGIYANIQFGFKK